MIKIGIYAIIAPNGKVYVGASKNIKNRWSKHKSLRRKGTNNLSNSFREFGVDEHSFEILEECKIDEIYEKEDLWKQHFLSKVGGDRTQILWHKLKDGKVITNHSKATKAKLSKSIKEGLAKSTYCRADDKETLENLSKSLKGHKKSAEGRRNMCGKGKSRGNRVAQYTLDGKFVAEYESLNAAARSLGKTDGGNISTAIKGFTKDSNRDVAYGYRWKKIDQ